MNRVDILYSERDRGTVIRDRRLLNIFNKRSQEHGSSLGPTFPIKPRCVKCREDLLSLSVFSRVCQ